MRFDIDFHCVIDMGLKGCNMLKTEDPSWTLGVMHCSYCPIIKAYLKAYLYDNNS